jgi:hypothetical protein
MNKVKDFFKGFIATIIVMLGSFLLNFYMVNGYGIISILCGLCGFLILYPAVKRWEDILSGKKKNQ